MPKTWYILTSAIHEDKPKEWHYYTKSWLITHVIDMFRFKLIIFLICDIYLKTKCEVVENNNDGEGEESDWAHLEFLSFTPVARRGDVNVGKRSVSAAAQTRVQWCPGLFTDGDWFENFSSFVIPYISTYPVPVASRHQPGRNCALLAACITIIPVYFLRDNGYEISK